MKKFALIFFMFLNLLTLFVSKAIANETDFVQWKCYESSESKAKLILTIGYATSLEENGNSLGYMTLETNKKNTLVLHKIKGIRDSFYWKDDVGGHYSLVISSSTGRSHFYDLSLINQDGKIMPDDTLHCSDRKIIKIDESKIKAVFEKTKPINKRIKISSSDIEKISSHVKSCFNITPSLMDYKEIVDLEISLNKKRGVSSVKVVDKSKYMKDKKYRALADLARRAVTNCSPFPVQKEKLHLFENFIMSFNSNFK